MSNQLNSYTLSRKWFDFCFENPEKINPKHTAIYFFAIEHCNRLGWKSKFGFPTQMVMDAIGIKSYNTYIKAFRDIVDWGFFKLIEKSQNQYSANIIALSNINKASNKSLDKAFTKHASKHQRSTLNSTDSINKQVNKETKKPKNDARVMGCPIPGQLQIDGFANRYEEYWDYMQETHRHNHSIGAVQSHFRRLMELQEKGNDPLKVIDQTMAAGNKSFYPLKDNQFNGTENKQISSSTATKTKTTYEDDILENREN